MMVVSKGPDLIHLRNQGRQGLPFDMQKKLGICVICSSGERASIFKGEYWCSGDCEKEYNRLHPQVVDKPVYDTDNDQAFMTVVGNILGAICMKLPFSPRNLLDGIRVDIENGETVVSIDADLPGRFSNIFGSATIVQEKANEPIEIRFKAL